jgi:hypothetical protein
MVGRSETERIPAHAAVVNVEAVAARVFISFASQDAEVSGELRAAIEADMRRLS